jgi:hypothetical protein
MASIIDQLCHTAQFRANGDLDRYNGANFVKNARGLTEASRNTSFKELLRTSSKTLAEPLMLVRKPPRSDGRL